MRSLGLLALIFGLFVPGSLTAEEARPSPVTIPDTEQFDLTSKAGQKYRIFVARPTDKVHEAGSPVIYLTDGNWHFATATAAARRLTGGKSALVVGVGYPTDDFKTQTARRTFDLTPATSAEWLNASPGGPPGKTGGQDALLGFLEDELKPVIEKRFKIDRKRQALFGHSLGGLFAVRALLTRPEGFQAYLASSPSLWWDDRSVLREEKAFAEKRKDQSFRARLLVTVGAWEEKGGPKDPPWQVEVLKGKRMVSEAREMAERLTTLEWKQLGVSFREFAEEDHGGAVLPAVSRGVRFALDEGP